MGYRMTIDRIPQPIQGLLLSTLYMAAEFYRELKRYRLSSSSPAGWHLYQLPVEEAGRGHR